MTSQPPQYENFKLPELLTLKFASTAYQHPFTSAELAPQNRLLRLHNLPPAPRPRKWAPYIEDARKAILLSCEPVSLVSAPETSPFLYNI